jgi:hypothetical protein
MMQQVGSRWNLTVILTDRLYGYAMEVHAKGKVQRLRRSYENRFFLKTGLDSPRIKNGIFFFLDIRALLISYSLDTQPICHLFEKVRVNRLYSLSVCMVSSST